jgi:hypothetical protein
MVCVSPIKNNLFMICCQSIANLSLDGNDRSSSIFRVIHDFQDEKVISKLEEEYAVWDISSSVSEVDLMVVDILKRMDEKEILERRVKFKQLVASVNENWKALAEKSALKSFKKIRNKISAHLDLSPVDGKLQPLDIGALDIKWKDIGEVIDEMQVIVEQISLIVCNKSFSWDDLGNDLSKAANDFWES